MKQIVKEIVYLAADEADEFESPVGIDAYQLSYSSCKGYSSGIPTGLHFPFDPVVGDNLLKNTKIYGVVYRSDLERDYLHGLPAFQSKVFNELADLKQLNKIINPFIQNLDQQGKIYYTHTPLTNSSVFLKIDSKQLIFCK